MTRLDSESLPFSVVWLLAEPEHWQLTVFFIQPTLQALALPPPFLQKQRTTFNCPLIRPFLLSPLFLRFLPKKMSAMHLLGGAALAQTVIL